MISRYIIKDNNLILFLDFNYEFSKDLNNNISFKKSILKYIKDHKINFNKGKILLVYGGLFLASFTYFNNYLNFNSFEDKDNIIYTESFSKMSSIPKTEVTKELKTNNTSQVSTNKKTTNNKTTTTKKTIKSSTKKKSIKKTIKSNNKNIVKNSRSLNTSSNISKNTSNTTNIKVYRSNGSVINLDLEEYVIGVVAAEMPASFNIEALKAQSILARTYALKSLKTGKKLTDTVSTQVYIDTNGMKKKWGNEFNKYYNKIKNAVDSTKGMYITYNGQIIDAVYHAISNGKTEDSIEVWGYSTPYLKSVDSNWDKTVSGYSKTTSISINKLLSILNINTLNTIEIISRDSSNRVSKIKVNNNIYSGVDFRTLFGLRSTDFDIEVSSNNINITTKGYGHGVGMSQYGANGMAKAGYTYDKIIKHYYSGVKITK